MKNDDITIYEMAAFFHKACMQNSDTIKFKKISKNGFINLDMVDIRVSYDELVVHLEESPKQ